MKRVLADLFFLAAACSATLLAFIVLIVCFEVPNTVGLDRLALLRIYWSAIDFAIRNKETVLWAGLLALLAIPITMKLLVHRPRLRGHLNTAVHRVQRVIRLR